MLLLCALLLSALLLCVPLCPLWFEPLTPADTRCTEELLEFCFAHRVGRARPFTQAGVIHIFALECCGYRAVHHQFRQPRRALVQVVNSFADRLITFFFFDRSQLPLLFGNSLPFLGGELAPSGTLLGFFQRSENRLRFVSSFN